MSQTTNILFEALANDHRRRILFDLAEQQSGEAEPIYTDAPPDATDSGETAVIERHHVHLPKLDDFGFVDWDPSMNTVEAGARFEEIRPALELLQDNRETLPVGIS